jgi:hypothetical protein
LGLTYFVLAALLGLSYLWRESNFENFKK